MLILHVHGVHFTEGVYIVNIFAMQQRKKTYHHGDLRNALVGAAIRLIETGRRDDFSLRETAREVGVSANAAYRHFEDRSALLTEVARSGFERLSLDMQRAMDSVPMGDAREDAINRFKAVGRAYVEFALSHPELFGVMFGASGTPRIAPNWRSADGASASPYKLLEQTLDELVVRGELAIGLRPGAEFKAWAAMHGFARLVLDGAAHAPIDGSRAQAIEDMLDFVARGLCGASAGPERQETQRDRAGV